ncbi:flagellar export chaperone FliS [Paenibacillus sp. P25]|nr:flagellar export chaperone FliS [Paenibacillus sp. P25]
MNPAHNKYMTTQINTAHPGDLTLMLYNGCLKFMKQAVDNIGQKNYESKNENLKKAMDIIDELVITLNMNYEISHNLYALYQFMRSKLITGNMKMDTDSINDVIRLMTELRDTWAQALKQVKSSGSKVSV